MPFVKGHTPVNKLSDTVAACNIIKYHRRDGRKNSRTKRIRIDFENDELLYITTLVRFRLSTGCITVSHNLRYGRLAFYPTVNCRLRCTNKHALEMLRQAREQQKEYHRKKKVKP